VLGDDEERVARHALPARREELADELGELADRVQLRLRPAGGVGQAEVQLEHVVAVRVLVAEVVVVAVVPGDPAAGAREERRVEHLAVVLGGVVVRREVGGDAELLQHDRLPEPARQLARERRRQRLPDQVVLHRVHVRAEEVHERRERAQRVAVVAAGDLDAPRAVARRDRLRRAGGADRVDEAARPRRDLVARRGAAVERHLVGEEPADDRRMRAEPAGDLAGEPRLLRHEPDVAVEIAARAPRRVPVLAGHVADDERGDRAEPGLDVRVEEVGEPGKHVLVEPLGLRHEVRPEAERPRERAPVRGEDGQLLAHDRGVVAAPHPWAAAARPEVRTDPRKLVESIHVVVPVPPVPSLEVTRESYHLSG
jgi:hypothetical protein